VIDERAKWEAKGVDPAAFLPAKARYRFYNVTEHTLASVPHRGAAPGAGRTVPPGSPGHREDRTSGRARDL
jgi:hypothetical protein